MRDEHAVNQGMVHHGMHFICHTARAAGVFVNNRSGPGIESCCSTSSSAHTTSDHIGQVQGIVLWTTRCEQPGVAEECPVGVHTAMRRRDEGQEASRLWHIKVDVRKGVVEQMSFCLFLTI